MLLKELREQVADHGKKMLLDGLTRGTGGYISIRDPDTGLICSTPSGKDYMTMTAKDVVVSGLDGVVIEGNGIVSSEWNVIKLIYSNRNDIQALVHCHSMYAVTLSALRMELPAAYFMVPMCGGRSVRCTGFHSYYSQDLADDILKKMKDRKAVLMGNHGMVACGDTLKEAYLLAQELEFGAEVFWRAKCIGEPYILNNADIRLFNEDQKRYKSMEKEGEK